MKKPPDLVLAGCARDVGAAVDSVRALVLALRARLGRCRVVIVEDGSTDDTRARLQAWAVVDPDVELVFGEPEVTVHRYQRMARCRNRYLTALATPRYSDADFIAVVDLDYFDYLTCVEPLVQALVEHPDDFDVLTANGLWRARPSPGRFVYHDTLAFRNPCIDRSRRDKAKLTFDARRRVLVAENELLEIPDDQRYRTRLTSAFGGLAVYRRDTLLGFRYDERTLDCEHVALHRDMIAAGHDRIRLNLDMILFHNQEVQQAYQRWRPDGVVRRASERIAHALRPRVWIWILRTPPQTGGERYCWEILRELEERGVACSGMQLSLWRRVSWMLPPALESCLLAVPLLFCRGPFLVDENFSGPLLVASRLRAQPVVILVHHMDRYQSHTASRWSAWWQRLRLSPARRLIAVSDYTRREMISLGVRPEIIQQVSPGCDEPGPAVRSTGSGPLRLLCVAPARPRKGLSVLIEALAHLDRADLQLTVVGKKDTDHFHERLAPLLERHNLNVQFLGRVSREKLTGLYAESDVLVCPSLQEGFGIVVAEALKAGLPVVASDASALPELVQHRRNGLLFKVGDPVALASAIASLADDTELRQSLRGEAIDYSWPRCRKEFLAATADLLVP